MIKLDISEIISKIHNYGGGYGISKLDEPAVEVLKATDWVGDRTGRGVEGDCNGKHYYIIFENPVLTPHNKCYEYGLYITCHLREGSKYNDDVFEFRIVFY